VARLDAIGRHPRLRRRRPWAPPLARQGGHPTRRRRRPSPLVRRTQESGRRTAECRHRPVTAPGTGRSFRAGRG
jgi:hypothetical protein